MNTTTALFPGFASRSVETADGAHIHARVGGRGRPLLLLQGHPEGLQARALPFFEEAS